MNSQDATTRTAERLRDALDAAADVMREHPATDTPPARPGPGRAWLVPLAAAAAVVAVVLASVLVAGNVGRPARTAPAGGAASAPPEFYLTLTSTTPDHVVLEVHSTVTGAVTAATQPPGVIIDATNLTADASDRAFYVASFPACTTAVAVTRFYRITIDGSGGITGDRPVGAPVHGMVDSIAVSPDGTRMAYFMDSFPTCANPRSRLPQRAISVMNLSTGAVRTWHNTVTASTSTQVARLARGLSWTADGRTVIANYWWNDPSSGGPVDDRGVLALNTRTSGGSIQASSQLLLSQKTGCVSCFKEALAAPGNTLLLAATEPAGKNRDREQVIRIDLPVPPGGLRFSTVLFSRTGPVNVPGPAYPAYPAIPVYADPSGQYVVTWPPTSFAANGWQRVQGGWIRDGRLVSLPGTTLGTISTFFAW